MQIGADTAKDSCQNLTNSNLDTTAPVTVSAYNEGQNKDMMQQHGVQGYPTIRYYPNGLGDVQNFMDYEGPRTAQGLESFVSGVVNKMPDNAQPVNQSN